MNPKLFAELTPDEHKIYQIGFEEGENKGSIAGFLLGLLLGVSIVGLSIIIINP